MPHPSSDLADLAGQFFKTPPRSDLADAGPAVAGLFKRVTHYEWRTRPFAATVFWQAYINSPSYVYFLDAVKANNPALRVRRTQVVPHPTDAGVRYDLLVLADGLSDSDSYYQTDAALDPGELKEGSARFVARVRNSPPEATLLAEIDHPAIATEAMKAQDFGVLLLPAPPMVPTALFLSPALPVRDPAGGAVSTAGVHAVNSSGQAGVTAAWHAIQDCRDSVVEVNGLRGQIVGQAHDRSDSAFVAVNWSPPPGLPPAVPLSRLVPRQHEPVSFEGSSSGTSKGQVTGWSPQLPFVSPRAQLVVTTGPISKPGDSGAALRDGEGHLLGFCHETSAFGAANPYSSWIWAESVFNAHKLT